MESFKVRFGSHTFFLTFLHLTHHGVIDIREDQGEQWVNVRFVSWCQNTDLCVPYHTLHSIVISGECPQKLSHIVLYADSSYLSVAFPAPVPAQLLLWSWL
jgi:hypothetical protein